jgi:opacity protein-like surface antigen
MMLKHSFAGAVAFFALASAAQAADLQPVLKAPPPAVDQQATGYVEVYGGWAWGKENDSLCEGGDCLSESLRLNGWVLGGAGRGNYWVTREVSLQLDAQAEGTSYDASRLSEGSRFSNHSYLIGGHWSWRNPQQYLFGLFAAAGDAGGFGVPQRHGLIGGEAQWYWSQFTLYLQGGYDTTLGTINSETDSINAWFIRSTGRYFVNPNFLLEGTFMYANGNVDFNGAPSQGFQTWTWQAKAEWRFPTAPFSVFAKYQGSETKYDTTLIEERLSFNAKTTDHRVMVGLKLHLGDKTLQQTDRAGATLDIISPLADPTSPVMMPNFPIEIVAPSAQ